MKLSKILEAYPIKLLKGSLDIEIKAIENDSRKVKEGYLFIAEKGYTVDGHDYIDKAIENGAIALVVEKDIDTDKDISIIKVEDTVDALAKFSSVFHAEPWLNLDLVGITGTNGKTSTTYFIKSIFNANNESSGIIGTNGAIIGDEKVDIANTTPNALVIHSLIKKMEDKNLKGCIMEVSSHALDLKRVEYMTFDYGIFTNLTKDHLDYHETMESYFASKSRLFTKTRKYNIVNKDDPYGQRLIDSLNSDVALLTYGIHKRADIYADSIEFTLSKVKFRLNTPLSSIDIVLNVPGEFSIYNALAAASLAYARGIAIEVIKKGLEDVEGIRGRFEVVPTNTNYTVIIDFAHTADGLDKVLTVIDAFAKGRKIVVFGAGGNRDKTKRPEMGATVGKHADLSIVTSDNPRFEDPDQIVDDVLVGTLESKGEYVKIVDRLEAIKYALDIAEENDIILLAGKGHEAYTIINGKTIPFDERQIVLDYLKDKN